MINCIELNQTTLSGLNKMTLIKAKSELFTGAVHDTRPDSFEEWEPESKEDIRSFFTACRSVNWLEDFEEDLNYPY